MDRRLYAVLIAIIIVLLALSSTIQAVHYRTTLHATPMTAEESDDSKTISDLPLECQRFARSLIAGQKLSMEEYRLGIAERTIILRHTSKTGWTVRDTLCGKTLWRLGPDDPLKAGGQSYNVNGHYDRVTQHQMALFETIQIIGILLLPGLILLWMLDIPRNDLG